MRPVETALLFVGKPTLALEHFGESLNARLKFLDIQFKKVASDRAAEVAFSAPGLKLTLTAKSTALPAETFLGAVDSPLSRPFRGMLSETLFRHNRHMMIRVVPTPEPTPGDAIVDRLTVLRVAHCAATLATEWHLPAAVYWRQSNQLLVGSQYLHLSGDTTPWALFAHARTGAPDGDATQGKRLRLDEATELIGRPIIFHQCGRPMDEVHASALSFLRYTVENGAPVPDGHTFGPEGGGMVRVNHVAPTSEMPLGRYDLTAVDLPEGAFISKRPSAVAGRAGDIPLEHANAYLAKDAAGHSNPAERSRSLAISYVMLLVMPPIGLFLLIFNALFGVNAWRTGLIATASVALALVVGAITFLGYVGQETAVFIDHDPIKTNILTELGAGAVLRSGSEF